MRETTRSLVDDLGAVIAMRDVGASRIEPGLQSWCGWR